MFYEKKKFFPFVCLCCFYQKEQQHTQKYKRQACNQVRNLISAKDNSVQDKWISMSV